MYAGGSFALGDYVPRRSDLDVAAVCAGALVRRRKETIVDRLRHEALPCPARGLEFVLYREETVRTPSAAAGFELDLNTGARMPFKAALDPSADPPFWYAIDRAIYRRHGVTLHGLPAAELFTAIPRRLLLSSLVDAVRWHGARGVARDDDAVLNACRAWRFAVEGSWSSKPAAGEWALARVEDGELVAAALAARVSGRPLPRVRVERFLRDIERRLGAGEKL